MSTWPKIAKCAWVIWIRFLISKFKKNNRRNCHWPVGMPYTPDVATIYPNIDTVLSNYVISDAIYDAGVINSKLSNHIAVYLALSIIINAASCLLLLLLIMLVVLLLVLLLRLLLDWRLYLPAMKNKEQEKTKESPTAHATTISWTGVSICALLHFRWNGVFIYLPLLWKTKKQERTTENRKPKPYCPCYYMPLALISITASPMSTRSSPLAPPNNPLLSSNTVVLAGGSTPGFSFSWPSHLTKYLY